MGVPASPTNVVNVRNSDTSATVTWDRHPTGPNPYTYQTVQMQTYTDTSWSSWVTVATVSATAVSYTKTGLSDNHLYQFRVRAGNTSGVSLYATAPSTVVMTPGAPIDFGSSGYDAAGTQITVAWINNHYTVTPAVVIDIDRKVGAGAWTSVATGLSGAGVSGSWTDGSPGLGDNAYRFKSRFTGTPTLSSAWVTGAVVNNPIAPLAPTQLAPNGTPVDLAADVTLSWKHNHGGDHALQTTYQIEYSTNGGGLWTVLASVNSPNQFRVVTGGTLPNGFTYLWRVRTRGVTSVGYGPFSAAATFVATATPTVTLQTGYPAVTTVSLPIEARWTYVHSGGSPQAEWEVELRSADGLTVLEAISGVGTATAAGPFTYPVQDDTAYRVRARVRSATGMWSSWVSRTTTLDLPPPGPVDLDPEYDVCVGAMILHLTAGALTGDEVAVVSVSIERRIEGGEWVMLVSGLTLPSDFIDPLPLTNGLNEYRITALSAVPSYSVSAIVPAMGTDGQGGFGDDGLWAFVAYGDAFAQVLRVHGDLKVSENGDRTRSAQPFLGRRRPGLLIGTNRSRTVAVTGSLHWAERCPPGDECRYDSPLRDWIDLGLDAEVVCYRDFTGRRLFGMISPVATSDGAWPGKGTVAFTVTEVDYTEVYGAVS